MEGLALGLNLHLCIMLLEMVNEQQGTAPLLKLILQTWKYNFVV